MKTIDTSSNNVTKENKRAYWLTQIDNWKNSKLSQEAYCKESGISYSTFVYWKGVLHSELNPKKEKKFLPVKLSSTKLINSEMPRAIQIKLLSGHSVYLPITMNINDISRIIHLLGVPDA